METLDGMLQRGSIALPQDVLTDFDDQVGADTQEEVVEGGVMQAA